MSKGFNRVILMGNLTKDPEVNTATSGTKFVKINVACNYQYKNKAGDYVDGCDFIQCVAFAGKAEFIGEYFKKGSPILIEGKIRTGKFQNKEGRDVFTTDVMIDTVQFVPGGKSNKKGSSQRNDDMGEFPDDISETDFSDDGGEEFDIPF